MHHQTGVHQPNSTTQMSLLQRLIDKYLTKLQRVPAALLLLIFFCTALVGSLYVCLPAALVLLVPCTCAYRRVADATAWSWFTLSAALLEWLAGVKVEVQGDNVRPADERVSILICNHHCRLDWMFLWCLAARLGCCGRLKIALKAPLKQAPFFGWAMQAFLFLFLSRKDREADLRRLRRLCAYAAESGPVCLLLFPEGTDLSPSNIARAPSFLRTPRAAPPCAHSSSPPWQCRMLTPTPRACRATGTCCTPRRRASSRQCKRWARASTPCTT